MKCSFSAQPHVVRNVKSNTQEYRPTLDSVWLEQQTEMNRPTKCMFADRCFVLGSQQTKPWNPDRCQLSEMLQICIPLAQFLYLQNHLTWRWNKIYAIFVQTFPTGHRLKFWDSWFQMSNAAVLQHEDFCVRVLEMWSQDSKFGLGLISSDFCESLCSSDDSSHLDSFLSCWMATACCSMTKAWWVFASSWSFTFLISSCNGYTGQNKPTFFSHNHSIAFNKMFLLHHCRDKTCSQSC